MIVGSVEAAAAIPAVFRNARRFIWLSNKKAAKIRKGIRSHPDPVIGEEAIMMISIIYDRIVDVIYECDVIQMRLELIHRLDVTASMPW